MFKFGFVNHRPDGTLIGVVNVSSRLRGSNKSRIEYYYSVLLDQRECRILDLIRQLNENETDSVYPDLTSPFRVVYKCHRTNFFTYSIYEISLVHDRPVMAKLLTFNHANCLGGWSTSGNYVVAYPRLLAKERGSLYIRNLVRGDSNFLELPESVKSGHDLHQASERQLHNNWCIPVGWSWRNGKIHMYN